MRAIPKKCRPLYPSNPQIIFTSSHLGRSFATVVHNQAQQTTERETSHHNLEAC